MDSSDSKTLCFSHKVIEQIESRNSKLKEELVTTKEQLNRALLDKDCLDQEKAETEEALRKAELFNAELGTKAPHAKPMASACATSAHF